MPRNFKNGVTVYVPLATIDGVKYVFNSRNDDADRTVLGQTALTATITDVTGFVVGCNAPKPGRATKRKGTGNESGFFDEAQRAALIAAGWRLQRGVAGRSPTASKGADFVYVTVNGVKYAWYCPRVPGATALDAMAVTMGVVKVGVNDEVVYGCSFPKPPRFKYEIPGTGTYSTFYEPSAPTVPDGVEVTGGRTSLTDLKNLVKTTEAPANPT
jgi:hypothetical protein